MFKFVDIIILRLKISCSVKMHTSGTFWIKKKQKKLDVEEGGNLYKFMDMMYKIHRVIYILKACIHGYCYKPRSCKKHHL